MKRLFALVLSFCMALSIGVCAAAAETPLRENENGVLLSSLDYEECRNFLLNQGVSIPEELSGIDLPKLFADLESNPDSDLRYLSYKSSHGDTTYTWTGEHYHSGTRHYYLYAYVCDDCGGYASTVWTSTPCAGPPCATPSSYTPELEVS